MLRAYVAAFALLTTVSYAGLAAAQSPAGTLTGVITDPRGIARDECVAITREAPDDEILLMDWLNAIVYEMAVNRLIFGAFDVHLKEHRLSGRAWGEKVDVGRHEPAVEVKGATMTALSVAKNDDGQWVAQCVVDV